MFSASFSHVRGSRNSVFVAVKKNNTCVWRKKKKKKQTDFETAVMWKQKLSYILKCRKIGLPACARFSKEMILLLH